MDFVKRNDDRTISMLFEKYQNVVYAVIKRFIETVSKNDHDDIKQVGLLALYRAACNFDDSKGVSFLTYAYRAIENAVLKWLENENKTTGFTFVSLDATLDDFDVGLYDLVSYDTSTALDRMILQEDIRDAMSRLNAWERTVIDCLFFQNKTETEISKDFNKSIQVVSLAKKNALYKMRKTLLSKNAAIIAKVC